MGTNSMVRLMKVVDLHGFSLEIPWEDAAVLNEVKMRAREKEVLWWTMESNKGTGWYLQRDSFSGFAAFSNVAQLKKLIRQGVPPLRRPKIWLSVSGAAKKRSTVPKSYFHDMIEAVEDKVTAATKQIDHDVPRTFPSHPWLDSVQGHDRLRRVLVAYSFRDSRVGYCQGMNFITAFLLLVMKSEEDAFWMLAVLLEDLLYRDTYSDNLYGCHIEQRVFKDFLKDKSPRLAAHFEIIGFDTAFITTEWFLCLFSRNVPSETTLRIWDVLFNEGADVLLMVALAIFEMKEEELLQATQTGEIIRILRDATRRLYDPDAFLKEAFDKLGFLTTYTIAKHRKKQQPVVMAELKKVQSL